MSYDFINRSSIIFNKEGIQIRKKILGKIKGLDTLLTEKNAKLDELIVGSRDFVDFKEFKEKVTPIFLELNGNIDCIISGGAKGTDSLAEEYAKVYKINTVIYRPDWKKYGRGAGIVRNRVIIENSDLVIAFIKNNSRGTANSIKVARELNKDLMVFELS